MLIPPGADSIPAWVFKKCSYELASPICSVINQSFATGIVPKEWQTAIVTPIAKVTRPNSIVDYRPISVTPILSRLTERLLIKYFLQPCANSDVFMNHYAFRPTGSTTAALSCLMRKVTYSLEANSYCMCVAL